MKKQPRERYRGSTLGFIAAGAIIIVLIAGACFFLTQLLGGARELDIATQSGTLNVAKQSEINPVTSTAPTAFEGLNSQDMADMNVVINGPDAASNAPMRMNLLNFNRAVASALLVSVNAQADNTVIGSAQHFVDYVEAGNTGGVSIGESLCNDLSNPNYDSWAPSSFNSLAMGGSLRMLGPTSQIQWQNSDFKPLFIGQAAGDLTQTNVRIGSGASVDVTAPYANLNAGSIGNLSSVGWPANWSVSAQDGSSRITGYTPISLPWLQRNIYGVPLPGQPHLISRTRTVGQDATNPALSDQLKAMVVPPNAFMEGSLALDERRSVKNVHTTAAAVAGSTGAPFPMQLKYDYVVIDNSATQTFSGVIPDGQNVFAGQLSNGVSVDPNSNFFSDKSAVEAWENWPHYKPDGKPRNPAHGPSIAGLYDSNGNPVTSKKEAFDHIPYNPGGAVLCTDTNSDPGSPDAICPCSTMIKSFDTAYWHPDYANNYNWSFQRYTTSDLTAGEQTDCTLASEFGRLTKAAIAQGGTAGLFPTTVKFPPTTTGVRLYPNGYDPILGQQCPWDLWNMQLSPGAPVRDYSQSTPGMVTTAGTLAELIDQTVGVAVSPTQNYKPQSSQGQATESIIKQRMSEIIGSASSASSEYERIVRNTPLPLGSKYYIYLDPSQNYSQFVMSTSPPPWFANSPTFGSRVNNPDGSTFTLTSNQYGIAETLTDPEYQWGIHDRFFWLIGARPHAYDEYMKPDTYVDQGNNLLKATDSVVMKLGSGAFGNLLTVQLRESTGGSLVLDHLN